jgi:hypothetical protein
MSEKAEHLKMVQTVISRMASNSFLIKGWCVTIVSAILALAAKEPNKLFIAVALFPVIMFWILDGYFLYQERLFRKLYESVKKIDESSVDYSMDTSSFQNETSWRDAIFSSTLNLFYIFILFLIVSIFCIALLLPSSIVPVGK